MTDDNRLAEALHTPPRIRAACLWGDNLEHRIDFDAAYWFQIWPDSDIMSHFELNFHMETPGGDEFSFPYEDENAEWGRTELVTEISDYHPGFLPMHEWLTEVGAAGWCSEEDEPDADPIEEYIVIYLSRVDAVEWLRSNRPDLYADIKSVYKIPSPEDRFFK